MHREVREQVGRLSVIRGTGPSDGWLLIYLILINFTFVKLMVRGMQLLLLDCLDGLLPHQLHQIVLLVVVLRWHAIDVDQLLLAGHPLHATISLRIKELFTVRARDVGSVVDDYLFAQAVEVHPLSIRAKAVSLVHVHAIEVAHLVIWRQ